MIDRRVVRPVELDTDAARLAEIFGRVVELVNGNRELQPGDGE